MKEIVYFSDIRIDDELIKTFYANRIQDSFTKLFAVKNRGLMSEMLLRLCISEHTQKYKIFLMSPRRETPCGS